MQISLDRASPFDSLVFAVSEPYGPGHVLTQHEARALNQFRAQRIRKNLARWASSRDTPPTWDECASQVARMDREFEFGEARLRQTPLIPDIKFEAQLIASMTSRQPTDPDVLKEAQARLDARREAADRALAELFGDLA